MAPPSVLRVCMALVLMQTGIAAERASGGGFSPPSQRVQEILGIPPQGREPLTLMEAYVAQRLAGRTAKEVEPLILQFAAAVGRGVEPDLLGYVDRVDVRNSLWYVEAQGIDPRTGPMLAAFERQLLSVAAERAAKEPDLAAGLARAYIVLRSHDRLTFGGSLPRKVGDLLLYDIAALPPETRAKLDALDEELRRQKRACMPDYKATGDILIELIETPGSANLWKSRLPVFVKHFRSGWADSGDVLMVRFALSTHAWRLVCLAQHNGVAEVEPALREATDALKRETTDPVAARWLDEIFTISGAAPKYPGIRVISHPNERKPGRP